MLSLCNLIILHDHNGTIYSLEGERETSDRDQKYKMKKKEK